MTDNFGDITVEELAPRQVVCSRVFSQTPEEDVMQAVEKWITGHGLKLEGRRTFGFDVPVSPAEAAKGLRGYEYGIEISEEEYVEGTLPKRIYGGGKYAVTRVVNAVEAPFQTIPAGWQRLIKWAQNNPDWQTTFDTCYEEVVPGEKGMDLILYLFLTPR
jgi:effector-binding domain-containing protein